MSVDPIALLFPGQGAQQVGMGRDLVEAFPAAGEVLASADDVLGIDLSRLCFEGPQAALSRSDIAQPAILAVSIAALRALQTQAGGLPAVKASAGLSLGEYTALVAAGALSFRQAVDLVRHRGLYMQEACEANPGAMYSVLGLEDALVEEACQRAGRQTRGRVWPANYNCPGQVVISGEEEPARVAADLCGEAGARRAVRLDVAGAFHTPLMQPAADRLAQRLDDVQVTKPNHPVVANVTGLPVTEPDEIRRLLVRQITEPVRWTDCVRWLIGQNVNEYYEIGPGRVLHGLLKRIDRERTCWTVNTSQDVADAALRWREGKGL